LAGDGIETHALEEAPLLENAFDVVADCTGSKSGLATALQLVRPCGTVLLKTTVAGEHTANLAPIVIDEVHVIGSRCGPFPKAIAALAEGTIDVLPLIEAIYPIHEADLAFKAASVKGVRKVLIEVTEQ
jgi:threonine dehydrogenase-like Zn-dependent dehydrogenase